MYTRIFVIVVISILLCGKKKKPLDSAQVQEISDKWISRIEGKR